jgi:hypothetical protein
MSSLLSKIQRRIDEAREKEMQAARAKRNGTKPTDAKKVLILKEKTVQIKSFGNQHRLMDFQIFLVRGHRGHKE